MAWGRVWDSGIPDAQKGSDHQLTDPPLCQQNWFECVSVLESLDFLFINITSSWNSGLLRELIQSALYSKIGKYK